MQKTHARKAIPGIAVELPPVSQKECLEDRTCFGVRQKTVQAGLDERTGRFEYASCTLSITPCVLHAPLHEIETSINALSEQVFSVIELAWIASTGKWIEASLERHPVTAFRRPTFLPVISRSKPTRHQQTDRRTVASILLIQSECKPDRSRALYRIIDNTPMPHRFFAGSKRSGQRVVLRQSMKRGVPQTPEAYGQEETCKGGKQRTQFP